MIITQVFDWFYYILNSVKIPIVLSADNYYTVSLFSIFIVFSILSAVYIVLKFLITGDYLVSSHTKDKGGE